MFSNMELAWDTLGRGLGYERIMDRIAIEGDRPN
jgi:hypothetical protein